MKYALLFFCACFPPAPETVDGLAKHFWTIFDAEPVHVEEAVTKLHRAAGAVIEPGGQDKGSLSDITREHVGSFENPRDPTLATGFYVLSHLRCTREQAEAGMYHARQQDLHGAQYDFYERTFSPELEEYTSRRMDRLHWSAHYGVTILGASYIAHGESDMRFVSPDIVLARTYQPGPAAFEGDNEYPQNYEMEVLYPSEDGATSYHLYAIWREIRVGAFRIEDELFLGIAISTLSDWDRRLETFCGKL